MGLLIKKTLAAALLAALVSAPRPAEAGDFSVELDPKPPIILGDIESLSVTIRAPERTEDEGRPLRMSVNVGRFDAVDRSAPGVYTTRYHLPETRFPQVALIAVWRETGPEAPIEFLRIPLSGRTSIPVRAKPRSEVRVFVGEEEFGPFTTGARGTTDAPIVVPPGVKEVVVQSKLKNNRSQATVDAGVPPYNRLTLAVTPYLVPADGVSAVTAHAFYDLEGAAPGIDRIVARAASGVVTPIGAEQNRYRFRFVPERSSTASKLTLEVSVKGDSVSSAKAEISLGLPIAAQLLIKGPIPALVADGSSNLELSVLVTDRLGLGVTVLSLSATTSAGSLGEPKEIGQGEYGFRLTAPAEFPKGGAASLAVAIKTPGQPSLRAQTGLVFLPLPRPASLNITTDPERPLADSEQPFEVLFLVRDAADQPLLGAGLKLVAVGGAAGPIEEIGDGSYRTEIRPEDGVDGVDLAIEDKSGGFRTQHRVPLAPKGHLLSLGARIGGAYNAELSFSAGIELGVRLPIWQRRLLLFAGASYRQSTVSFSTEDQTLVIDATLRVVPVSLGATFDLVQREDLRVYAGAAGSMVFLSQEIDFRPAGFTLPTEYARAPALEITAGASLFGAFLELAGSVSDPSLPGAEIPGLTFALYFGYRWEVL